MTSSVRAPRFLGLIVVLLPLQSCGRAPSASSPAPELPPSSSLAKSLLGMPLFQQSCAPCHGEQGDGHGLVALDRPARSFQTGAFSFGNTPAALFRTIEHGIGGTPMPAFAESLSAEQIQSLVQVVLDFGPEVKAASAEDAVFVVEDRPLAIRGTMDPVADGCERIPRGLLVGGLDGLSFQYNTEDLRLLAVRQGGFALRKDWENRGGDPLQPLGHILFLVDGGHPQSMWVLSADNQTSLPLFAQLKATEALAEEIVVEYDLLRQGRPIAKVRERGRLHTRGGWIGIQRHFEVTLLESMAGKIQLRDILGGGHQRQFLAHGSARWVDIEPYGACLIAVKETPSSNPKASFDVVQELYFGQNPSPQNLKAWEEAE